MEFSWLEEDFSRRSDIKGINVAQSTEVRRQVGTIC
jgi:hypothetical protein